LKSLSFGGSDVWELAIYSSTLDRDGSADFEESLVFSRLFEQVLHSELDFRASFWQAERVFDEGPADERVKKL
jgi:hypothetical protein